ncbi:recombination-associated protein RdgC (plasmid) [Microbulbifer sp. ANSA001]|uniref:recombination-associated protein RdgC n=1 Tax=Microbulbifer sp. ANSA001 TaxID=3243358 RepID=UPI0040413DB7
MFKSVVVYRFCKPLELGAREIAQNLKAKCFTPPAPTEAGRCGFVPPAEQIDSELLSELNPLRFLRQVDGRWVVALRQAVRKVKPAELQKAIQKRAEEIGKREARPVLRREREQIKQEVLIDLLPHAFPEEKTALAYITPRTGLLIVEASGHNGAELFLSALREATQNLPVAMPQMSRNTAQEMMSWLKNGIPAGFRLGLHAEFRSEHDGSCRVTLNNEDPTDDNAQGYREGGYEVAVLALETDDGAAGIDFRLTDELLIKQIKPQYKSDDIYGIEEDEANGLSGAFDAELVLFAGILDGVWQGLVEAFGGYYEEQEPATWKPKEADLLLVGDSVEEPAEDPLYEDAAELVKSCDSISMSFMQRKLRIGYNRAALLVVELERRGVVSPPDESGQRSTALLVRAEEMIDAAI